MLFQADTLAAKWCTKSCASVLFMTGFASTLELVTVLNVLYYLN